MKFDLIVEMVNIISQHKIKKTEVLGKPNTSESLTAKFYSAIAEGKVHSDEEAAQYLYGYNNTSDTRQRIFNSAYLKLKERLVRQIITTTFFIDVNDHQFTAREKAYYNCHRNFAAATTLYERGARNVAFYFFKQILEQAISFEFTSISSDASSILKTISIENNSDSELYSSLSRKFEDLRHFENLARDHYEELINYFNLYLGDRKFIYSQASQYYDKIYSYKDHSNSTLFSYYVFQINIIKLISNRDYDLAIRTIDETLGWLNSRPMLINSNMLLPLVLSKLRCFATTSQWENFENTFNYFSSLCEVGGINWFNSARLYFYYCTYSRKYGEALRVFKQVKENRNFNNLPSQFIEHWKLFEAYLYLLSNLGVLVFIETEVKLRKFKISKFINEMIILNKDKMGMNISIVLLRLLFGIVNKNYMYTIDSLEGIEKYFQRYVAHNDERSNTFFKVLSTYIQRNFHFEATSMAGMNYLDVLRNNNEGFSFGTEIIPYEHLCELVLKK